MDKFILFQFYALLKKEIWENRTLILGVPCVVALVIFVINFLILAQLSSPEISSVLGYTSGWFEGMSPYDTAPTLVLLSVPFVTVFFFSSLVYLLNALYQDRKDMSILFWQSMPVSNFLSVLSKIATVTLVSPAFLVAVMAVLYFISIAGLAILGFRHDVEIAGFGFMLAATAINLAVTYLFVATSVLWLLPLVGWLLLFSAFARRAPMLWSIAAYFLLGFLEEFAFGSHFLSNWAQTRFDPDNFIIVEFGGIFDRLFSYDMLAGLVVGSILVTGAVYMRRYVD